jgi:putative two-component system response regulator
MADPARVLIVDDLEENLEVFSEILEPEGYRISTAGDGREAVDKALADPPDLVIMDVSMPKMTGIEACQILKHDERTRFVPIVLVTALVAREDRIAGKVAGCDDFLSKPVDFEELKIRTRSLLRMKALTDELEVAENVLVSLARALEAKDKYTQGHSERVANYAEELGGAVGLSRDARRNLKRAGLLHDIGKIGIPGDYLRKRGKLTAEEYEEVKRHPGIGFEICKPLRTMAPIVHLIRGHHERLDGLGYPDGLAAEAIPLAMRCLSTSDVYDALTTERAYRAAMSHDEALVIMRSEANRGLWDLRVIDTFAETLARLGMQARKPDRNPAR